MWRTDKQTGTFLMLFNHVFSTSVGNIVVINGFVSVLIICSRLPLRVLGLTWNLSAQIWFGVEILQHSGVSLQPESTLLYDASAWTALTIVHPWQKGSWLFSSFCPNREVNYRSSRVLQLPKPEQRYWKWWWWWWWLIDWRWQYETSVGSISFLKVKAKIKQRVERN